MSNSSLAPVQPTLVPSAEGTGHMTGLTVRHASFVLLVLSVAVAGSHIALGPNFVLDDFFNVHEGIRGGLFSASTPELAASRPGMPIAYGLTFGLFGNHPLPIVLIASLVNIGSAQLLFRTAMNYLPRTISFALTALWIALPNHMAIEIWPSTIMISTSLLLGLAAINLMGRSDMTGGSTASQIAPAVIFAFASSAFYEGSLPLMCLAMFAIPRLKHGAFSLRLLLAGAITQGALAGWIFLNLPPSKAARDVIAPRDIIAAFYGQGIVPVWFEPVAVMAFMTSFALFGYTAIRDHRFAGPEQLVLGGFVIMLAGIAPYLRYFFTASGPGDRLQYFSSIGGTATIVGILWACWVRVGPSPKARAVLKALAVVGLVLVTVTRVEGTIAWNRAGDDGVTIRQAIEKSTIDPQKPVVLGPEPLYHRGGLAPFLDPSNVRPALIVLFDEPSATGFMTFSEESFLEEPADQRLDIRPVLETN